MEEGDASIYVRTVREDGWVGWYGIHPGSDCNLMPEFGDRPAPASMSSCVAVGSCIYVIGGVKTRGFDHDLDAKKKKKRCRLLSTVYWVDTKKEERERERDEWKQIPSKMGSRRANPYSFCYGGGQIYIAGGETDGKGPFLESFHVRGRFWDTVSVSPPPGYTSADPILINAHVVSAEDPSLIFFYLPNWGGCLYSFDTDINDWSLIAISIGRFRLPSASLGQVLYLADPDFPAHLFSYDVSHPHSPPRIVQGLDQFICGLPLEGVVAIGHDRLCLVSTRRPRFTSLGLRCFTFNVMRQDGFSLASNVREEEYYLFKARCLMDFIALEGSAREMRESEAVSKAGSDMQGTVSDWETTEPEAVSKTGGDLQGMVEEDVWAAHAGINE